MIDNSTVETRRYSLIAPELRDDLEPRSYHQTILNEAKFGYRHIREHIAQRPADGRVLEIGSVPGCGRSKSKWALAKP